MIQYANTAEYTATPSPHYYVTLNSGYYTLSDSMIRSPAMFRTWNYANVDVTISS